MRRGTVQLELDDADYTMEYRYTEPVPATYYDPPEGGVQVDSIHVTLAGGVRLEVPADRWHELKVYERLIDEAFAQQREQEAAA